MNVLYQISHRFQLQLARHFRAHVQVDPGNEKIAAPPYQFRDIAQASLRIFRDHVAQKVVREHHVLLSKGMNQIRIGCIGDSPIYSLLEPAPDSHSGRFVVKQFKPFLFGHSGKDILAGKFTPFQRVDAFLGEFQRFLGYVGGGDNDFQVTPL